MDWTRFSRRYLVRPLGEEDVEAVFSLCQPNTLYYTYCPPFVTRESIRRDMRALPRGKSLADKYYLGYFDGERLIAVMDFIAAYPNEKTAFIGFFMVEVSVQNTGVGSGIISELSAALPEAGFTGIRLGWVAGNPQAAHFWHKNGFAETGLSYQTDGYTVIIAHRALESGAPAPEIPEDVR